jgi:hypothetical protein
MHANIGHPRQRARDLFVGGAAGMAEGEWELLTLRGLAMTDESASEFVGTLVIHRGGSAEPVENVTVRIKRSALEEISSALVRLLARSTRFSR